MADLQESLARIERGIAELACAQGALVRISETLCDLAEGEEISDNMDMLHIVICYLDSVVTTLDNAAGDARAAVKTMQ